MTLAYASDIKPALWNVSPFMVHPMFWSLWDSKELHLAIWEEGGAPFDVSGNGNDATLPGGSADPTWGVGSDGPVMIFDGAAQYLSTPIGTLPGAFTAVIRAKRNTVEGTNDGIVGWGGGGSNFAGLLLEEDGDILHIRAVGNATATFSGVWTDKTSYHTLVFVAKSIGASEVMELYFDGVSKGTRTAEISQVTGFRVGELVGLTGKEFSGSMSFVSLISRALTAFEIALISAYPYGDITPSSLWVPSIFGGLGGVISTRNTQVIIMA